MNLKLKLKKIVKKIDDLRTIKGWKISFKPIIPLKNPESFLTRTEDNEIMDDIMNRHSDAWKKLAQVEEDIKGYSDIWKELSKL